MTEWPNNRDNDNNYKNNNKVITEKFKPFSFLFTCVWSFILSSEDLKDFHIIPNDQ